MRLLDRYLLRHFLLAFLVCFTSLLALYIVVDAFTKLDEFTERSTNAWTVLGNMGTYYLYRLPWFFERLSAVLCLLSALFTLAWLERNNELMAFLSAGIPTRRLLYPLIAATLAIIGLSAANRELLIPRCSSHLQRSAEDPRGKSGRGVLGCYDDHLIHIEGKAAYPDRHMIEGGKVTLPSHILGRLVQIDCKEMYYRPAHAADSSGWYLLAATPAHLDCNHPSINWLAPGAYFLHTELGFAQLTRQPDWFCYEPTSRLFELAMNDKPTPRRTEILALLHRRLTTPLLELLLVLLGIPFVLGRRNWNFYLKMGLAVLLYAVFHGVTHVCGFLAGTAQLDPILGAWLPVMLFGPAALAMLDGIRT